LATEDSISSTGFVNQEFARVRAAFDAFLESDEGYSAQLCIYLGGERVVDLVGGPDLRADSLTGVYSATKGAAALAVARVIEAGALDLEALVVDYWPEFGANGKAAVTVGDLLAHRAGLNALDGRFTLDELFDSRRGGARLAAQAPLWKPGSAFGYHALTIGLLMEELVRRATGRSLHDVFENDVRAPRGADFFIGLPESEDHRYVRVHDPVLTDAQRAEIVARPPADAVQDLVFSNTDAPDDRSDGGTSTNNPRVRRAGPAAIGGVGSARGLARLYADALPTSPNPIASAATFRAMAQQRSWGQDRTLNVPNCFGAVFMLPQPRMPFGSVGAFGHDGAGGALAFADPRSDLAFGYVPVPMQYPGGADARSIVLARLAQSIARSSVGTRVG
jgi:CubicO group peptidase (beta-lactamase class C family)